MDTCECVCVFSLRREREAECLYAYILCVVLCVRSSVHMGLKHSNSADPKGLFVLSRYCQTFHQIDFQFPGVDSL